MDLLGTWILRFAFASGFISFILIVFKKETEVRKNLGILMGLVSCLGVLVSSILLVYSLVKGVYSIEYVYHNTEKSLPIIYKISAFWSGSAGSMLFWTSVFAVLLIIVYMKSMDKSSTKTVFGTIIFVMTLFMFVVTFINNPFKHVSEQTDGFGLNPALQSIGMVFHPPVIIVAFSFFFIAFCYQLFDLKEKNSSNGFVIWKWAIWGWILLTAGIVSGGLWAYTELGWGGYWAWDPIENSSLVNWLFATAFLHGIRGKDHGYGRQRVNFMLITMTAFTILVGTFFARSGLLKSVHAYSSQGVTIVFGGVLIVLAVLIVFTYYRIKRLHREGLEGDTEDRGSRLKKVFYSLIKPVNLFTALCVIIAVLIFGGTAFPLFGGLFFKDASVTSAAFYDYSFGIFGLLVLLCLAVCPGLFSGRRILLIPGAVIGITALIVMIVFSNYGYLTMASLAVCAMLAVNFAIELIRNQKKILSNPRYVSFIILHFALLLMALGFTGSRGIFYSSEKMLDKNNTLEIHEYSVKYRNLYWKEELGKTTAVAVIGVSGPKGRLQLKPELSYYQKKNITHSRAIVKAGIWEDLYIIFEGMDENDRILIKVMVLRWVSLVWIGGLLLIVGALLEYLFKRKEIYL
ncbi:cytochrome c biogenesis protein CcsA [Pseudobacteroides cellulosolvens]|uniref:Cytochrome c assembly protein n=1 Tax=Pseudobacteroides cellulosolvens ATCC 35603 = DSM 2933 TaxID=398512 RepID=A0A0L6JPS6_9FIRM|nr:cytochrome c biogenesis protein CcsA [Pseudobacteroides cellulosolvens]KNY27841.1 cytochrome c assembly protein [Pseudobacteroides cellulosolvens ATCC 35603 = DSM 2933]